MRVLSCNSIVFLRPLYRSGTAAQIRNQVSAAFSSVDGADSRAIAFPASQGTGALMLTQTLMPAGAGAHINPVLVCLYALLIQLPSLQSLYTKLCCLII